MLLYLLVHRNPLAAQCLQRSLRSIRRLQNEKVFRRNLLNSLFSSSACLLFESEPVCSPAGPQEPSGLDYFGKKFFVQIQIKESPQSEGTDWCYKLCLKPGNFAERWFLILKERKILLHPKCGQKCCGYC